MSGVDQILMAQRNISQQDVLRTESIGSEDDDQELNARSLRQIIKERKVAKEIAAKAGFENTKIKKTKKMLKRAKQTQAVYVTITAIITTLAPLLPAIFFIFLVVIIALVISSVFSSITPAEFFKMMPGGEVAQAFRLI